MVSLINLFDTTAHKLEGEVELEHRPYLGMSQLGNECSRYLWYQFRWAFKDTASKRMLRLWARGHREEPEIIKELNKIGIEVWGDQTEMIGSLGHIKGHNDGICKGVIEAPKTTHLAEFKTVNDKGFKDLQKKHLEKYSPTYYGQCQLYMHYLKLTRTLFIAVNKNDDTYYVERIKYDKGYAQDLIRKGDHVLMSDIPTGRAFPSKTFYKCKWCSARDACWNSGAMEKNCRTCQHVNLEMEGKWSCGLGQKTLTVPEQRLGCEEYNEIPR